MLRLCFIAESAFVLLFGAAFLQSASAQESAASSRAESAQSAPAAPLTVAGTWRAEAVLPIGKIEAFLEIDPGAGPVPVRITILKLGLRRALIAASRLEGQVVELEIPALGGGYRGTLAPDGRRITGMVTTAAGPMLLDFARVDSIPRRFQEPKHPLPYAEEQVSFPGGQEGIRFRGTLTAPRWPGPHPAVVLITGPGCQDRDATMGDARPFLVLADYLTRRGVVVLRYDDRGFKGTQGNVLDATSDDFASDALAAIAFISNRREVDAARTGLIGHSEGGMVAMIAASRSPAVKFVVSLAGLAEKCERLAYDNMIALAGVDRLAEPLRPGAREALWRALEILKSDLSDADAAARLKAFLPAEAVPMLTCRWTRFIARYDPAAAIERVSCPVLALFGEADSQVLPDANAAALRAALARGGNNALTVVTFPRLDHKFQIAAPTTADGERCNDTIAPDVLEKISSWILEGALAAK